MALPAIFAIFDTVWTLVERVQSIRDLAANNASSLVTTADVTHVIRAENMCFFVTVTLTDIETTHNRFYNTLLPSVLALSRPITPADINRPGQLSLVFSDLISFANVLSRQLNQLRAAYRQYSPQLHVDDITRGLHSCVHGYTLLIHMHATSAELRRIQIGAATLNDPRLLPDTLLVLDYLCDSIAGLDWFRGRDNALGPRLNLITPISSIWPGSGSILYRYNDTYVPLSTTTNDITLDVPSPPPHNPQNRNRGQVEQWRAERVSRVSDRQHAVVTNTSWRAWDINQRVQRQMWSRERVQRRGTRAQTGFGSPRTMQIADYQGKGESKGVNEGVSIDEGEGKLAGGPESLPQWARFDVPEGVEDFLVLAERLCTEVGAQCDKETGSVGTMHDGELEPSQLPESECQENGSIKELSRGQTSTSKILDDSRQSLIMRLAYTARNAPVRFHEQSLSGLLSQLDSIESFGDEGLRAKRKEVVGLVESALEDLEREVEGRWRVKVARDVKAESLHTGAPVAEPTPFSGSVVAVDHADSTEPTSSPASILAVQAVSTKAPTSSPVLKEQVAIAAQFAPAVEDAAKEALVIVIEADVSSDALSTDSEINEIADVTSVHGPNASSIAVD
ncbi:hypothetical protein BDZ89DRAFT_1218601 [Hymenopellis radicata]|nr:hypothetical protein BDZ89DRAFT_1218601 [Hymenopellis radicata]